MDSKYKRVRSKSAAPVQLVDVAVGAAVEDVLVFLKAELVPARVARHGRGDGGGRQVIVVPRPTPPESSWMWPSVPR